jgi:ribose 5-phosphate isomerase B
MELICRNSAVFIVYLEARGDWSLAPNLAYVAGYGQRHARCYDRRMRFSVGSDEGGPGPDAVVQALRERGHDVTLRGPLAGLEAGWADVAHAVAADVASGEAEQGVLFCWTGTGVSIAANKTVGVRAALCGDAETARGARAWNDANVLCLGLRTTTPALAREIVDAWLAAAVDEAEAEQIARIEP